MKKYNINYFLFIYYFFLICVKWSYTTFLKRKCDNYCGADILYELWLQDQNKTTNLF